MTSCTASAAWVRVSSSAAVSGTACPSCCSIKSSARRSMRTFPGGTASVFYNAPVIITVSCPADGSGNINAALATENICLAAESLGLGSCIIGLAAFLFNTPGGERYFNELQIPEGYKPIHAVCVGYKNMENEAPERAPGKVAVIE